MYTQEKLHKVWSIERELALTVLYGDYMKIPPVEKQVNHEPGILILEGAEE